MKYFIFLLLFIANYTFAIECPVSEKKDLIEKGKQFSFEWSDSNSYKISGMHTNTTIDSKALKNGLISDLEKACIGFLGTGVKFLLTKKEDTTNGRLNCAKVVGKCFL